MTLFNTTALDYARPIDLLEESYQDPGVAKTIALVIDWDEAAITAETRDPTMTGISERQWHGRVSAYLLPANVDATQLREWVESEVVPRAVPLAEVYEIEWDGDNYRGTFPGMEEEKEELDAWMDRAQPPTHDGGLWRVGEWIDGTCDVRPETTDDELRVTAGEIIGEAESVNVVIAGGAGAVYGHLSEIREDLREEAAREPDLYKIEGFEVLEKSATAFGSSAHVIVPRGWVGGRVKIVRLEP